MAFAFLLRGPTALLLSLAILCPAGAGEIRRLLELPEDRIDIGVAALVLAKEAYPRLDVRAYSSRLDTLASRVRHVALDAGDRATRVDALNTVIFQEERVHYDQGRDAFSKPSNYFLHGILDTKKGTCYTMPLLYAAVAQRAGYPVYLVAAPDHVFARYVDPVLGPRNIEVTSGGKYIADESYLRDFFITRAGITSGSYMRTLSRKETVAMAFVANAAHFASNGHPGRALEYLKEAIRLNPSYADTHKSVAELYMEMSLYSAPRAANNYRVLAKEEANIALSLWFVGREDIEAARGRQRR